jgi:hypothetical protein
MSAHPLAPLPAWDRLAAPTTGTLNVQPLRRASVEELLVIDDELPQFDGATLFWAWADEDGWSARAALIVGEAATPFLIHAARATGPEPAPAAGDRPGRPAAVGQHQRPPARPRTATPAVRLHLSPDADRAGVRRH